MEVKDKAEKLEVVKANLPPPAVQFAGVNIEGLLAKAIDAKSAVEVLERLMVMRREAKAEAAKEAFDLALAAFQAECPVVSKTEKVMDRKNPGHVRYRYAPLDSIVGQVKECLAKHGFSYSLTAKVEDKWVTALLTAKHSAGHSEPTEFKIPVDFESYMNKAQQFASALTFAKRYAFCNAFGILTGDWDDDGQGVDPEHAAGQDRRPPLSRPVAASRPAPATKPAAPAPAAAPAASRQGKAPPPAEDPAHQAALVLEFRKLFANPVFEPELVRYLREAPTASGRLLLMPNEGLEDLSSAELRSLINHWDRALPTIELWLHENPPKGEPTPKADPGEAWREFVVPIPRKGMKRDEYLKDPDTLGRLYDDCKDDEEARKRLFGMAHNFQPSKSWVGTDGQQRQRSAEEYERELDFRDALDEFLAWHEANKGQEAA